MSVHRNLGLHALFVYIEKKIKESLVNITNNVAASYTVRDKLDKHKRFVDGHKVLDEINQVTAMTDIDSEQRHKKNMSDYQELYKEYLEEHQFVLEKDPEHEDFYLVQVEKNIRLKLDPYDATKFLIDIEA
jgi:hypothetical protein